MSPDNRAREIQTLLEQAQTHNQQDDRPAAESCLRKVLSISPVEVNALYGLVVFSLDVSPPADIRTLIAEQFEQQGQNPEFHFNLGKALSRAKLYAQASESFRRAASHASDPSGCYNQVGLAEESLQAFEKAAEAQVRHYTYGVDLACGIRMALESDRAINETFNLSTATSTTVRQLAADIWAKVHGAERPLRLVHDEPFAYDVRRRVPDTAKARDVLGFEATTTLPEMLDEVLPWIEDAIARNQI